MAEPYIGEIMAFGGTFAPVGYMMCAGQLVPIAEYDALYNLIGTTYGGDGQVTFGLPDLRSRVPIHMGQGPGLPNYTIGQNGGTESVTLTTSTMAGHNHLALLSATPSGSIPTAQSYLSNQQNSNQAATAFAYGPPTDVLNLAPNSVSSAGSGQPHENRQPLLAITYCIAMVGIYPQQS